MTCDCFTSALNVTIIGWPNLLQNDERKRRQKRCLKIAVEFKKENLQQCGQCRTGFGIKLSSKTTRKITGKYSPGQNRPAVRERSLFYTFSPGFARPGAHIWFCNAKLHRCCFSCWQPSSWAIRIWISNRKTEPERRPCRRWLESPLHAQVNLGDEDSKFS